MTRNERIDAVIKAFDVRIDLPAGVIDFMTEDELDQLKHIADKYARAIRNEFNAYMENERNVPKLTVVK